MRSAIRPIALFLAIFAVPPAWADGGGIVVDSTRWSWARLQARVAWTTMPAWRSDLAPAATSGLKVDSASLLGDVYPSALPTGMRATSGLMVQPRSGLRTAALDSTPLPYLGVGYSNVGSRGAFRFSADLGVVFGHATPGDRAVRFAAGGQGLDEAGRDPRLSPVVKLGVSYSF